MHTRPRILLAVGTLLLLTTVGTVGFAFIEGLDWIDSIYLTVATISTVGFGDIIPTTRAGQLFTIGLIVTGVGAALYLFSVVAQDILEGRLRDFFHRSSMMREIKRHSGHVIVCGYGRYGRVVVDELKRANRTVVVIESDDPDSRAR